MRRDKNTEDDDRSLSGIAAEANQLGVDLFFSIHSNAGEDVNYPIMLYREETLGNARYPENITLSEILGKNLYSNKLPVWTHPLQIAGDLTFYLGVYKTGLGVLRTLYTVGLLSEGGMHEHRPEAYRLMNDDYWWLEAWHFVAKAISRPLNHFTIPRETVIPAISTPHPNIMKPTAANLAEAGIPR